LSSDARLVIFGDCLRPALLKERMRLLPSDACLAICGAGLRPALF